MRIKHKWCNDIVAINKSDLGGILRLKFWFSENRKHQSEMRNEKSKRKREEKYMFGMSNKIINLGAGAVDQAVRCLLCMH